MILEQETYGKFGYYPSELSPKSGKKILAACDDCGKVRAIQKRQYRAFCPPCSRKGDRNARWGKHHSEETRRKISKSLGGNVPWNKGKTGIYSEEARRKISEAMKGGNHPNYGKHHSEETKRKIGEGNKGKNVSEETRLKLSEVNTGKKLSEEHKKKIGEAGKGREVSEETRQKMSKISKMQWQDLEYIKKMVTAMHKTPNKGELFVDSMLQKHRPNNWKFNGNFEAGVAIGGLIPDFVNINGQKVVIEVFGEPFHDPTLARKAFKRNIRWVATEFGRKAVFAQLGYKCVVFWSLDLRTPNAEQFVLETLEREGI